MLSSQKHDRNSICSQKLPAHTGSSSGKTTNAILQEFSVQGQLLPSPTLTTSMTDDRRPSQSNGKHQAAPAWQNQMVEGGTDVLKDWGSASCTSPVPRREDWLVQGGSTLGWDFKRWKSDSQGGRDMWRASWSPPEKEPCKAQSCRTHPQNLQNLTISLFRKQGGKSPKLRGFFFLFQPKFRVYCQTCVLNARV